MPVSLRTQKMLWGRAANRCAFVDCRRELFVDATETDDPSLVGQACHIIAERPKGPRGAPAYAKEQLDKYENLILLCAVHHKIIDDQRIAYSVERLREIKRAHEDWVRASLEIDTNHQHDQELCASYVDEWSMRADLPNWRNWTSYLLAAEPALSKEISGSLKLLRDWLLSRIWPTTGSELEKALLNFRLVLTDLLLTFHAHSKEFGDLYMTEKFYKLSHWDAKLYEELSNEYGRHVDLVHDLTLELTRAANYVCDKVRHELLRSYRLQEGALVVEHGPNMQLRLEIIRPEYRSEERTARPYPGITDFVKVRYERDFSISP